MPTFNALKIVCFIACCAPLIWLGTQAFHQQLGANPIETVIHFSGLWALRLLLITLTVTPLRIVFDWQQPLQIRRMLGLFSFFYATLHVLAYVVLDQYFAWPDIFADIIKRPYITLGLSAWILLVPLAITSTHKMIGRLGWQRWQRLHQLIYIIAVAALLHYALLIKAGWGQAWPYIAVFALLMVVRIKKFSGQ